MALADKLPTPTQQPMCWNGPDSTLPTKAYGMAACSAWSPASGQAQHRCGVLHVDESLADCRRCFLLERWQPRSPRRIPDSAAVPSIVALGLDLPIGSLAPGARSPVGYEGESSGTASKPDATPEKTTRFVSKSAASAGKARIPWPKACARPSQAYADQGLHRPGHPVRRLILASWPISCEDPFHLSDQGLAT